MDNFFQKIKQGLKRFWPFIIIMIAGVVAIVFFFRIDPTEIKKSKTLAAATQKELKELDQLVKEKESELSQLEENQKVKETLSTIATKDKEITTKTKKKEAVAAKIKQVKESLDPTGESKELYEMIDAESLSSGSVYKPGDSEGNFVDNEEITRKGIEMEVDPDQTLSIPVKKNWKLATGTFFITSDSKNSNRQLIVRIYGDGNLLHESGVITKGIRSSDPEYQFNLNISQFNTLTFEFNYLNRADSDMEIGIEGTIKK